MPKRLMPFALLVSGGALLSGCLTMSGNYEIQAYDQTGKRLDPNIVWYAEGRHVYTVRNALCMSHPDATLITIDLETGEQHPSESPHRCR